MWNMRKRDKKKEKREILSALAMITQIGLAMMTCMAMSFGIGFYIDRLLGTRFWVMIFLIIGILASIRSLFILTGRYQSSGDKAEHTLHSEHAAVKGEPDEGSKKDAP